MNRSEKEQKESLSRRSLTCTINMIFSLILLLVIVSSSAAEQCRPIDCSSVGYRFKRCDVPGADFVTRVILARKYSRSPCNYGSSYGKEQRSIWVNRGCRARFNVCFESNTRCTFMDCSSHRYRFAVCQVPFARVVLSVSVSRRYSRASCRHGHGFGKDGGAIWVNHGCRAHFRVCYAA